MEGLRRWQQLAVTHGQEFHCLGMEPTLSTAKLKQAYRKRALVLHPDKGGSPADFRALKSALENTVKAIERLKEKYLELENQTGTVSSHT